MYIFPITSRCFTTGWSLTQMNTGGIHSEFLGNFLNTGCRTTARTARIRNKFTKQSSTSNCFPSGCFKFWLLRCLAQTTNKSLAESDRRLTDTEIGMPQLQSTQVQFAICTPCSYATVHSHCAIVGCTFPLIKRAKDWLVYLPRPSVSQYDNLQVSIACLPQPFSNGYSNHS